MINNIDSASSLPCLARLTTWDSSSVVLPALRKRVEQDGFSFTTVSKLLLQHLTHILFVLSMVENLDQNQNISFDLYARDRKFGGPFHLPTVEEAFDTLTKLVLGPSDKNLPISRREAAVVSDWGWCICVSSIGAEDPCDIRTGLAVVQGVPMRTTERRRFIVDLQTLEGSQRVDKAETAKRQAPETTKETMLGTYQSLAGPGERFPRENWTSAVKPSYYIGLTNESFQVTKRIRCKARDNNTDWSLISTGFRSMQDTFWKVVHLPACAHVDPFDNLGSMPLDTWAFRGFGKPDAIIYNQNPGDQRPAGWTQCAKGSVHVALVAGQGSARWTAIFTMPKYWHSMNTSRTNLADDPSLLPIDQKFSPLPTFLRPEDCCFSCAMEHARNRRRGLHVGLVL